MSHCKTARLVYQNEPNGIVERPEPMHNNAMYGRKANGVRQL